MSEDFKLANLTKQIKAQTQISSSNSKKDNSMILTLCGSARFEPYYHEANKLLGLSGHICFGLMTYPSIEGSKSWYTEDQKWMLDLAHFAKIEDSYGAVFLNINHYLGESSLRELKWARLRGKKVFWTVPGDARMQPDEITVGDFLTTKFDADWPELIENVFKKTGKRPEDFREKASQQINHQQV